MKYTVQYNRDQVLLKGKRAKKVSSYIYCLVMTMFSAVGTPDGTGEPPKRVMLERLHKFMMPLDQPLSAMANPIVIKIFKITKMQACSSNQVSFFLHG